MPRYIDADDYKNRLRNEYDCETVTGLDAAVYVLDNMQTADVVEVVRCKDCAYSFEAYGDLHCEKFCHYSTPDDFCSRGERRDQ